MPVAVRFLYDGLPISSQALRNDHFEEELAKVRMVGIFKMMKLIEDNDLQEHSLDAVCSFLTKQVEHWQDSRYTSSMLKALESEMQVDSARLVSFIDAFKRETGTDHEAVQDLVQGYIRALPSV